MIHNNTLAICGGVVLWSGNQLCGWQHIVILWRQPKALCSALQVAYHPYRCRAIRGWERVGAQEVRQEGMGMWVDKFTTA